MSNYIILLIYLYSLCCRKNVNGGNFSIKKNSFKIVFLEFSSKKYLWCCSSQKWTSGWCPSSRGLCRWRSWWWTTMTVQTKRGAARRPRLKSSPAWTTFTLDSLSLSSPDVAAIAQVKCHGHTACQHGFGSESNLVEKNMFPLMKEFDPLYNGSNLFSL